MVTIEHCEGRITAFKEVLSLISLIHPEEDSVKGQLKILENHIKKQIELDEHWIDSELELMEGRMLLEGLRNGRTL